MIELTEGQELTLTAGDGKNLQMAVGWDHARAAGLSAVEQRPSTSTPRWSA